MQFLNKCISNKRKQSDMSVPCKTHISFIQKIPVIKIKYLKIKIQVYFLTLFIMKCYSGSFYRQRTWENPDKDPFLLPNIKKNPQLEQTGFLTTFFSCITL